MANGAKAAAVAIAAAATAILALGASTAEYRAEQAKLVTAFEAAGSSAEVAKGTYNDLFRVLGDSGQATEAAGHLAKLTTSQQALSEWTTICQGVYATFGDSLPIEGLTEAANETAKVGTVTGSLADALNWAGISEDAFNEKLQACNTEAEREALIRETLNGLYADAAAKYEENNAAVLAQNEANAALQDRLAAVGAAVAPVVTAFTQFGAEALAVVTPYIQSLAENYLPNLQSMLTGVADALSSTLSWMSQHSTLLTVIISLLGILATAIGLYNAVAAVKAAMAALEVTSVWGLVTAYAAQAAAMAVAIAPYALIVAAIAAVIAIIVVCVKHWDTIKATVIKVWEIVKEATISAVEAIISFFSNLISSIVSAVSSFVSNVVSGFTNLYQSVKSKVQNIVSSVSSAFSQMVSTATQKAAAILSAVGSKFDSIKSKIKSAIDGARDAVKSAIDRIKSFFDFSWSLPPLKLPRISITGSFSLNPISVPKFSITWNKLGGVFDMPTLFNYGGSLQGIGEDGAEAVVPLEKNLGWLNKLADMLSERMGGNTPVVLTVDGKVFAQTAINTINQNTRQTGKLALNLV